MTRKIVLATFGSLGDLHPFIAVGRALQTLGFAVTLASAAEYRDKVLSAGLSFQAVRPSFAELEQALGMSRQILTQRLVSDDRFLFRQLVLPYLRAGFTDLREACADAELIVASSLAYGARLAAEIARKPCIGVALQPMMFLSSYDPPLLRRGAWALRLLRTLGPAPTRVVLRLVKRSLRRMFAPLDQLRAELGLPALAHDPLFEDAFAAGGALGLYSTLLGAVHPDFPPDTCICGFAPFDSSDGDVPRLDAALERFLAAGAPPLVFTLGSLLVNDPGSFYRVSAAAARRLRMRAVLLVGEEGAASLADLQREDLFMSPYAPHSLLFPRAAALVHHGGIGTLAQGLRAGRPQLLVPHFADQFDNAARAGRLGVSLTLRPAAYRTAAVAAALRRLLQGAAFAGAARRVAGQLCGEDGAASAARYIAERLARRR